MGRDTESALAELVFVQLQDQIPNLYKFLTGFQVIEEQDGGQRVLGFLAFNVNNRNYYMPVFFINGYIKPLILLYNFETQMFIAATPKAITYLTKPHLGINGVPIRNDNFLTSLTSPTSNIQTKLSSLRITPIRVPKLDTLFKSAQDKYSILKRPAIMDKVACWHPEWLAFLYKPEQKKVKQAELVIKDTPSEEYTPEENKTLYSGALIIEDNRPSPKELVQIGLNWRTPDKDGMYALITDEGDIVKKYVFTNVLPHSSPKTILVYDPDTSEITYVNYKQLIGLPLADQPIETKPLSEMVDGSEFIIVNKKGQCTTPVKYQDGKIIAAQKYILNPRSSQEITEIDEGTMIISKDVAAVPVKLNQNFYMPGSVKDMLDTIPSKNKVFIDYSPNGLYTIKSGLYTKQGSFKQALVGLVADLGYSVPSSKTALKKCGVFINPDASETYESQTLPTKPDEKSPDTLNLNQNQILDIADRAAQSGSQTVFDAALLGILAKQQNTTEKIKVLLPQINQVIHGIGSQLFSLWWNTSKFSETYTVDEIYELEQSLLDVFKELTDISLTFMLKEKIVSSEA